MFGHKKESVQTKNYFDKPPLVVLRELTTKCWNVASCLRSADKKD